MIEYKARTKPNELITYEALNKRMKLSTKEKQHYLNLKKGYEGEVHFDSFTEKLRCECLILNDLLLKTNHTTFQLDTLIIAQSKIYFYEVKNHEGNYFYESDKLYKVPNIDIINPLHQIERSKSLLQRLLLPFGYKLPIDATVVFINPSFTMYQAPLDKPIIYPTQVKNYLNKFNAKPSTITDRDFKLADQFIALHESNSPYEEIPTYNYKDLQKGMTCLKCNSFSLSVGKITCVCQACGQTEKFSNAVLRNIKDFNTLFPNEKLTTKMIADWCKIPTKKRIRNVLLKHYNKVGSHRWAYFE